MFFKKGDEIRIDGHTYPISNGANVDCINCKFFICGTLMMQLGHDMFDCLEADTYVSWRKDTVKCLKDWDKMYMKH